MSMVRSFFGTKETNNASKVSIYLDMFSGHPDMIQVDRYLTKLKNGEFRGKNAFFRSFRAALRFTFFKDETL